MSELKHRYDFALVFDVKDGNPNGDPDAGNLPRIDPETSHGLVTDVCLKRKIRNAVSCMKEGAPGYDIFVKERAVLNVLIEKAYGDLKIDLQSDKTSGGKKRKTKGEAQDDEVDAGRREMCKRYFDVRTFGAVMSTGANAGQVRGPVQFTFARSVDPIFTLEHSITRMAVATEEEAQKQAGGNRTMGRKNTVPYGVYVGYGFVSPQLAKQTGFSEEDLQLLWSAMDKMFELDRSAARGLMSLRRRIVFQHASPLGDKPAHRLFDALRVKQREGITMARAFTDYEVVLDRQGLDGVEVIQSG